MSYLRELFGGVASSLLRNKLRSFLTMAGIAWGVASIVLIVAMGDGFKLGQRDRFRQLGENIVIVFNGRTELQAGGRRAGRRIRLDLRRRARYPRGMLAGEARGGGAAERRARREPVQQRIVRRDGGGAALLRDPQHPGGPRAFPGWNRTIATRRAWRCWATTSASSCSENTRLGRADTLAINGLPFRIVGLMPPKNPEQQLQRPGQRQDLHSLLHHGARPAADRRRISTPASSAT